MKSRLFFFTMLLGVMFALNMHAAERKKYNFNSDWGAVENQWG